MLPLLAGFTLSGRMLALLAVIACMAAAVWGYGYLERRAGREEGRVEVRAAWKAAKDRQREIDAGVRRDDARAAGEAAAAFETWRAGSKHRQAEVARALKDALKRPLSCPPGAVVGDVLVPAAAVERLRDAGADRSPTGPTAAGADR